MRLGVFEGMELGRGVDVGSDVLVGAVVGIEIWVGGGSVGLMVGGIELQAVMWRIIRISKRKARNEIKLLGNGGSTG